MRRLLRYLLRSLLLLSLGGAGVAHAVDAAQEYALKAAFIYNFAKFIDWPKPVTGSFNICLVGRDNFGGSLDSLERKTVKDLPIRVQRGVVGEGLRQCQMLFFGDRGVSARELAQYAEQGTLTLADQEGFLDLGGIFLLAQEQNRLVFDVNLETARRANFSISSRLLRLARKVR
jgi:hypothetical protein